MRSTKMYAVPVDALNAIIFSPKAPPKGYEEYHGNVQNDVSLFDDSPEIYRWPECGELPHVILARSQANSNEYRVFRSRNQFNGEEQGYTNTGRSCCIAHNSSQFVSLIKAAIRMKHRGEWIGWSEDGNRLVATGKTPEEASDAVAQKRGGPAIFEWVEPPLETDW
jgi:hypothetical protein